MTGNLKAQLVSQCKEIASNCEAISNSADTHKVDVTPITKCVPSTFKMTSYRKHKTENDTFYSPSFCTSPKGYTIRIGITANGSGDGRNTHLSVLVHLMHGDNDECLSWPFTGVISIELLNQLADKYHQKKEISLMSVASGTEKSLGQFVPHTVLEQRKGRFSKNCQYLE